MPYLTRAERRGAWLLAAILLLSCGWDLFQVRFGEPRHFRHVTKPAPAADTTQAAGSLDLNAASAVELEALPGIGPVLAERIVAHRSAHGAFGHVEELLGVRGVGPRLFARVKGRLRVSPQP